ncbi:MAG: hypothetical protein RLZZ127_997 [Planctomycetota bacterium]|jgi:predicted Zn-dependent protease
MIRAAALAVLLLAGCDPVRTAPVADPRARIEADRIAAATGLWDDGLLDQAEAAVADLERDGIAHPQVRLLRARLTAGRDPAAAAAQAEVLVAEAPTWLEPRVLLLRAYDALDRDAAVASVCADIDRLFPWSAWGPYGQGAAAAKQGRWDDARTFAQEALRREPDAAVALELAATVARHDRDATAETALLERLTDHQPRRADAWWRLADLAAAAGRSADADRHRDRAWALDPRPDRAKALAAEADAAGDPAAAARWRARAAGRQP